MSEYKTIKEREEEITDEFSLFDSWEEKYEYIIDLGKRLEPLEEEFKVGENIIKGCQSTVWLTSQFKEGKVFYKADSDAIIVKGLISMLIKVLSGHKPDEILEAKLNFIKDIGMMTHLAQTRSNGLLAMVKQIKNYALAYKSAGVAFSVLIDDFPDSDNSDSYALNSIKSYYKYAEMSVVDKQPERFEKVINDANDFDQRFPGSKLLTDVDDFKTRSENYLKKLQTQNNEQIKATTQR